jgi:hypothetical protein
MTDKTPDIGDVGCVTALCMSVAAGAAAEIFGSPHWFAIAVVTFASFYAAIGLATLVQMGRAR